jgi:hypothetical protein
VDRDDGANTQTLIFEELVNGLTWRTVELAGCLSREATYLGNWPFGVALVGIRGLRSFQIAYYDRFAEMSEPYSANGRPLHAQGSRHHLVRGGATARISTPIGGRDLTRPYGI